MSCLDHVSIYRSAVCISKLAHPLALHMFAAGKTNMPRKKSTVIEDLKKKKKNHERKENSRYAEGGREGSVESSMVDARERNKTNKVSEGKGTTTSRPREKRR